MSWLKTAAVLAVASIAGIAHAGASPDFIHRADVANLFLNKRQAAAPSTYVGRVNNVHPSNCSQAAVFRVGAGGALFIDDTPFSVSPGATFAPLRVGVTSGSINAVFSNVGGSLAWTNADFFGGRAGFCQDTSGQVFATFRDTTVSGNLPPGCTVISLSIISRNSCQNGVVVPPTTTPVVPTSTPTSVVVPPTTSPIVIVSPSVSVSIVSVSPSPSPTLIPNPPIVDEYAHLGCFGSTGRFPSFLLIKQDNANTIPSCIAACGGSKLVGLFNTDCYCGSFLDETNSRSVPETECSILCPGDPNTRCGGRGLPIARRQIPLDVRLSLYLRINDVVPGGVSTVTSVSVSAGPGTTVSVTFISVVTNPPVITGGATISIPGGGSGGPGGSTLSLPPGLYTEGAATPGGQFCRVTTGSWIVGSTTLLPFPQVTGVF
ncbi:wsc domain-containing protein [Colletotrichum plurivorum]|uniref:Wsc domain-containing protein n=1 Tax=Colletotrichum plurivorum TaxID=2175906 RepID=A0A8H6NCL3_9PEZI|nr:wsc domain-containing protein [Colletotrichum plurivorum]